ncbi:hypothetical protein AOLI_G00218250 [Acnodon oligacanthus]
MPIPAVGGHVLREPVQSSSAPPVTAKKVKKRYRSIQRAVTSQMAETQQRSERGLNTRPEKFTTAPR